MSKKKQNEIIVNTLKTKSQVEAMLKANDHFEIAGMINVYICNQCQHEAIFSYLDSGVTPISMNCPQCGCDEWLSTGLGGRQPDSVWYRPNNLDEIKVIVDEAYEYTKKQLQLDQQTNLSEREMKRTILTNCIIHYNQGGLFSKKLNVSKREGNDAG